MTPFTVPPFEAPASMTDIKYVWWSWHPNYPHWSKSCWEGKTEEEAWAALAKPFASSMEYYHNKLIREGDGQFVEVADVPCRRPEAWENIARLQREGRIRDGAALANPEL
jgi:hypothetical protein